MTLTLTVESMTDSIQVEFDAARVDLVIARQELGRKDTPAARARVAACLARLDAALDMWNEIAHVTL